MARAPFPGILRPFGLAAWCPQVGRWQRGQAGLPVPEFVGHGEGQGQACVLIDIAAAVWLAHARHMGQAQGLAGLVHGCTQVLPTHREK